MAATDILDVIRCYGRQYVVVFAVFYPQATSAPTLAANQSRGVASVARSAAGRFLLTLDDPHHHLVAAIATTQLATAADMQAQIGTISNLGSSSATTVVVRTIAGATETDIAANANNSVSVLLVFGESDAF